MVRNKNIGGLPNRSSTGKTKKAGSKTANSKDLTPLDEPADRSISANSPELQTTGQGQLGFPDIIYLLASVIFQNNHREKPAAHRLVNYGKERGLPLPQVKDEKMQRTAYELAFNTLKYQELLEDIMIDSCFYLTQPTPNDQMSLVAVMLYDFQDRKFLPRKRHGEDEIVQEVKDVESFLLRSKTKLAASLARCRIKHNLLSIDYILPESVKIKQERSSSLPLYTWVNTLKSSVDEVQSVLKSAGFSQVKSIGQLEGQTFCQDSHCGDILVFPAQLKAQLYTTRLLRDHTLIIQDKFCSLGPNAVCSLLPEEGDVLMLGCFSGLTVSHTASLIAEKHKANSNVQPTVYVCVSDRTNAHREELQQAVTAMGSKNVTLIPEDFQSLDSRDKRLQKLRVILLTPKCSVSAVSNPVEFILQENGDTELLQDLSQSSIAQSKLEALVAQQRTDIDHALKFSKVLAVVYSTCSSYKEENEEVVSRALEQAKACSEQEGEPKQSNFRLTPGPFSMPDQAEGPNETHPFFFMLEPSERSNGCFLAVLSREPEPEVKEAPYEVIVRANAKGILDGIGSSQLTRKEQRQADRMTKTTQARTSQPHLSARIHSRSQETVGSHSTTLRGHLEFTNRRPSLQGKAKAMQMQPSKYTVHSSFPSSKPESNAPKKSITPVLNTAPTPSPATALARPCRARQEVPKPVVLVLPRVHFPNFLPPPLSRTGSGPSFDYMWRPPAQSRGQYK
ncbi:putative methyltransferase NSUN7 [Cyclopterus lumpus]|uniref:putative methyltransferase NSUN7 n=1 Tax=Cyclopterus lumpus TaxID=8103 RepID=UPI0014863FE0|nr:putative methyltransferase NSUN7 [Cyclopterus lumpus]